MTTLRAGLRVGLVVLAVSCLTALPAGGAVAADATPSVGLAATLAGTPLEDYDEAQPLVLDPQQELEVRVEITNPTEAPLQVRYVRLDGRVLGMTFFNYSARVDATIEPGATDSREFTFDLSDLGDQATGLFPARLMLLDAERQLLTEEPLPVEVQGSLGSTYGIFSLLVAVATALLLGVALLRLAFGGLTAHRWFRATRFAVPGAGVGLTLVFTLSALGVLVPSPDRSLGLVIAGAVLGLVLGFLTPAPYAGEPPRAYEPEPVAPVPDDDRIRERPDGGTAEPGPVTAAAQDETARLPFPPPRAPGRPPARQDS